MPAITKCCLIVWLALAVALTEGACSVNTFIS